MSGLSRKMIVELSIWPEPTLPTITDIYAICSSLWKGTLDAKETEKLDWNIKIRSTLDKNEVLIQWLSLTK